MTAKNLLIFGMMTFAFFSCTETDQQKAERLKTEICGKISARPSSSGFLSAKKIFNDEISKIDPEKRGEVVKQFMAQAEDCIKAIRFRKHIIPKSLAVEGNCESIVRLDTGSYAIMLNANENPSFFMNLNFIPTGKTPDKKVINEIKCSLEIYGSDGFSISEVNFYPTPDLKSLLTDGKKQASISVPLFPLWKTLDQDPLGIAANSFAQAEKAASFAVKISIITSGNLKSGELEKLDKQYDEILDKLNKK